MTRCAQQLGDLFAALGFAMWMADEAKLAALGAVAGAGPAYVARFIDALTKAGEERGLSREIAATIARETVLGTAWMAATDGEGMDVDRAPRRQPQRHDRSRPGRARPRRRLDQLVALTIDAAARRGAELARKRERASLAEAARLS